MSTRKEPTDRELVHALLRFNPFGGYRLPRNAKERKALRATLKRYEASSKPPRHGG